MIVKFSERHVLVWANNVAPGQTAPDPDQTVSFRSSLILVYSDWNSVILVNSQSIGQTV